MNYIKTIFQSYKNTKMISSSRAEANETCLRCPEKQERFRIKSWVKVKRENWKNIDTYTEIWNNETIF